MDIHRTLLRSLYHHISFIQQSEHDYLSNLCTTFISYSYSTSADVPPLLVDFGPVERCSGNIPDCIQELDKI